MSTLLEKYIGEHYNGRIFKCYAVYLRNRYGHEIFDKICKQLSITEEVLVNETSWFSNAFYLDFLNLMKRETGDLAVAQKAGQIFVNPEVVSPLEYAALASKLSPYLVLRFLPQHYRKYNRINTVKMLSSRPGNFKFAVYPSSDLIPPIEICGSTVSMVGSIKNLFDLDYAEVIETSCIHKDSDHCVFEVSYSGRGLWKKRFAIFALSIFAIGLFMSTFRSWIKDALKSGNGANLAIMICSILIFTIGIMLANNFKRLSLLSFYFQQTNDIANSLASERAARAKDSARSDLAHEVAHDIRSPIAALEVAIQLADSAEKTELINKALARVREITSSLIGISRPVDIETLNVQALVKEIVEEKMLELTKNSVRHVISLNLEPVSIAIKGSRAKFCRCISNILNNAVEAVAEHGEVNVDVSLRSGTVLIRIADSGVGLAQDKLAEVGRRGFTYNKVGGSGLGIYLAKEYTEEIGGEFIFESEKFKGTTVSLIFSNAHFLS